MLPLPASIRASCILPNALSAALTALCSIVLSRCRVVEMPNALRLVAHSSLLIEVFHPAMEDRWNACQSSPLALL
eukprot:238068-Rhodomonas_salina.1